MITNLFFLNVFCLILDVTVLILYIQKNVVKNAENKIYRLILTTNLIGLIIQLVLDYVCINYKTLSSFVVDASLKMYLIQFMVYANLMLSYVFETFYSERPKKFILPIGLLIVISLLITILPIELYADESNVIYYSYGASVDATYYSSVLVTTIMVVLLFMNIKKKYFKKLIPLYLFILFGLITAFLQKSNPEYIVTCFFECFICFVMYFTIENPDARLVEYEKREKELAVSASEAKTAFLSSMSHELRTPLNAIVGLSEDMLSFKEQVPSEVQEDCVDIVNASNTLLELIGNILDISKIEGGKLELIESDYLPHEEIESLLKIMRTKMEEKDLEFNIFIDPNIPECLYGDRLRIKQIINNFLSNAAKYTEKGSVNFGVRWVDNQLQIRVSDTGRGIKKEDMDKLFEKFERLHVEKSSSVQGTGLGLAITKNLVELMGGKIVVSSVFGKGSTFDVYIPQKLGNKDNIVREQLSVEDRAVADYTGKKVLVVDDNKLNIKVLRKAIASFNFEIDECYDGLQALDKIANNKYDLILMDIMMPNMGGEETIVKLKENPSFNTPVIALTADATTGAKERYLEEGFNDYLAKPFSRDIIAQKLDNVLGNTK